jgi:glycosyltransferase involved in cell wall biosynthesis
MQVRVVDPSAYTPAYDHALCAALARAGAEVELITSSFAYGEVPPDKGYCVRELFYRHSRGPAGSRLRTLTKLLEHAPDMLELRRQAGPADLVHFQWLPVQWLDRHLLPAPPVVLTAHDLLPREPRPLQVRGQLRLYESVDAVVAHSEFGRRQLVERLGVPEAKVSLIRHGAFDHLTRLPDGPLPAELDDTGGPVVLFFGLLRPYKGVQVLLQAWRGLAGMGGEAQLWIVGRPRMDIAAWRVEPPPGVQFVPRYVSDSELAACFRRCQVVVLPYLDTERFDFSGVLATALAFGTPSLVSDVGGFGELARAGAVQLVTPGDPGALAEALSGLLADRSRRQQMGDAARALAEGPYSWNQIAQRTLELYRRVKGGG